MISNAWSGFYARAYAHLADHLNGSQLDFEYLLRVVRDNPRGESHAEFVAIALAAFTVSGRLPQKSIPDSFLTELFGLFHAEHTTCNWRLMAFIAKAILIEQQPPVFDEALLLIEQTPDGVLLDEPNHISSQYHAYILLLLCFFFEIEQAKPVISKAFAWVNLTVERFGNFGVFGRGKFQKFGYASLLVADRVCKAHGLDGLSPLARKSALGALIGYQKTPSALSEGFVSPALDFLQHGYNTAQDYNEFTRFWLELASSMYDQSEDAALQALSESWAPILWGKDGHDVFAFKGDRLLLVIASSDDFGISEMSFRSILTELVLRISNRLWTRAQREVTAPEEYWVGDEFVPGWLTDKRLAVTTLTQGRYNVLLSASAANSYDIYVNEEWANCTLSTAHGSVQVIKLCMVDESKRQWALHRVRMVRCSSLLLTIGEA